MDRKVDEWRERAREAGRDTGRYIEFIYLFILGKTWIYRYICLHMQCLSLCPPTDLSVYVLICLCQSIYLSLSASFSLCLSFSRCLSFLLLFFSIFVCVSLHSLLCIHMCVCHCMHMYVYKTCMYVYNIYIYIYVCVYIYIYRHMDAIGFEACGQFTVWVYGSCHVETLMTQNDTCLSP